MRDLLDAIKSLRRNIERLAEPPDRPPFFRAGDGKHRV
jgi:hypothetical protein